MYRNSTTLDLGLNLRPSNRSVLNRPNLPLVKHENRSAICAHFLFYRNYFRMCVSRVCNASLTWKRDTAFSPQVRTFDHRMAVFWRPNLPLVKHQSRSCICAHLLFNMNYFCMCVSRVCDASFAYKQYCIGHQVRTFDHWIAVIWRPNLSLVKHGNICHLCTFFYFLWIYSLFVGNVGFLHL